MNRRDENIEPLPDDLLDKNQKVDAATVDAYRKLERKLSELGVKVATRRYSIAHPLGSNRTKSQPLHFNHSRFHNRSD